MPPLGVMVADFILGLFIGIYALASFAPVRFIYQTYRLSWLFAGLFLIAAYLQKHTAESELSLGALSRSRKHLSLNPDQVETLIITVIVGIALSFIGGMLFLRKRDAL